MADIIDFPKDESGKLSDDSDLAHDQFLADEGLDLLAAYRLIEDPDVRASVMQLVKTLSGRLTANG